MRLESWNFRRGHKATTARPTEWPCFAAGRGLEPCRHWKPACGSAGRGRRSVLCTRGAGPRPHRPQAARTGMPPRMPPQAAPSPGCFFSQLRLNIEKCLIVYQRAERQWRPSCRLVRKARCQPRRGPRWVAMPWLGRGPREGAAGASRPASPEGSGLGRVARASSASWWPSGTSVWRPRPQSLGGSPAVLKMAAGSAMAAGIVGMAMAAGSGRPAACSVRRNCFRSFSALDFPGRPKPPLSRLRPAPRPAAGKSGKPFLDDPSARLGLPGLGRLGTGRELWGLRRSTAPLAAWALHQGDPDPPQRKHAALAPQALPLARPRRARRARPALELYSV